MIQNLTEAEMNEQGICRYDHNSVNMMFDALDIPQYLDKETARQLFIHACQATFLCVISDMKENPQPLWNSIQNKVIKKILEK